MTAKLPPLPGIYKFLDQQGKILYIGKAKNLKNRVRSYFAQSAELTPAKQQLVSKISKIDYTVLTNETEALLVESTLINQWQPPYNIIFKDDKSWVWLKLDKINNQPKLLITRKVRRGQGKYFGPYTSAQAARQIAKVLKKIFPVLASGADFKSYRRRIDLRKFAGEEKNDFQTTINQVTDFLNGQTEKIAEQLERQMKQAAAKKNFERAGGLRDQLKAINQIKEKQKVIWLKPENLDLISIYLPADNFADLAIVNLFKIRQGKLMDQQNFTLKNVSRFSEAELVENFINQYYPKTADLPKQLIVPTPINSQRLDYQFKKISLAQKGIKKQLLNLGLTNAQQFYQLQLPSQQASQSRSLLKNLQQLLKLPKFPKRIEAYDISNLQSKMASGSMVVFTNAQPDKSQYRCFNIKTVDSSNDPAMIAEVIGRRKKHQSWPVPDLILIDGGSAQLNAALAQWPSVAMISLAKKLEEIYLANQKTPLRLSLRSPVLQLLQRLRDEAHRFAISGHQKIHQRQMVISQFDQLPGIGTKTKTKLLKHFGSWEQLKEAKLEEITPLIGKSKAKILLKSFD